MKRAVHSLGVLLAVVAGVWHMMLMTSATNDNFLHLALAQQWLAGDWPVRDFFDNGWVLQYTLTAVSRLLVGNRLLAEAIVVGLAWAFSTWLVFRLVRRLSGSVSAATVAAILPILAGARGYSYPKGIVYAVAAALWWRYVHEPARIGAVTLGAWTAAAFYFRPDHGLYVAVGVVLALVAAHRVTSLALARCIAAGATTIVLVLPYLVYVQLTVGLPEYLQTGAVAAQTEHTTQGPHEWPLLRLKGQLVAVQPADDHAPVIGIRWTAGSSADARQQIRTRYQLTTVEKNGSSERVRLSAQSLPNLRALLGESIVEDSSGVERSSGEIPEAVWSTWEQWMFSHSWLRLRLLPFLDRQARASEFIVTVFFLLPLATTIASIWISRYLGPEVTAARLCCFGVFALVVDFAMLRHPFTARAPDAVVLPAILFGLCVAALWHGASAGGRLRRVVGGALTVLVVLTMTTATDDVGQFTERFGRISPFSGNGARARGEIYRELVASPPLSYYLDRPARFPVRLAAYVRECVPETDRLLVLWFEPEIYYYSERLAAQRHLVFARAWAGLRHEQQMTLAKIQRFMPPVALIRQSSLDEYARASFPGVVAYVEREYEQAAAVEDGGEQYLIYRRRARVPPRTFGPQQWPCFVHEQTEWSRVGQPPAAASQ